MIAHVSEMAQFEMRLALERITSAETSIRRVIARYDELKPVLTDCDDARQYFARQFDH
jgi:hypothetical protein